MNFSVVYPAARFLLGGLMVLARREVSVAPSPQPGMWWWATNYARPATDEEASTQARQRLSQMLAVLAGIGVPVEGEEHQDLGIFLHPARPAVEVSDLGRGGDAYAFWSGWPLSPKAT